MKRKKHRLLFFMLFIVFLSIIVVIVGSRKNVVHAEAQKDIAKNIIRFHVRANSDSEYDQQLKLKVKDAVVDFMQPLLANSSNIDESRQIIQENLDSIIEKAREALQQEGADNEVTAYFENSYFPMKSYGDITFPPGEYEAFRIDIGKGSGKNWWCVLYPPLCFVEATHGVLPEESKNTLKNVLTEEEYNMVSAKPVKFRFKYLTFLNQFLE